MEFQSKIDQNSGEEMNMAGTLNQNNKNNPNPLGPKDYMEKKQSVNLQNVKSGNDQKRREQIILNDRTDVLDSDYQPHHIESEFLSYEKINFKLKWSTFKRDMKMKVFKNIFRIDHIHGNIQEYIHNDKNLDDIVLPKYSKNFLEDENIMDFYNCATPSARANGAMNISDRSITNINLSNN